MTKGWFPKGWFWQIFPRNENRNEGTFGCSAGTKTGTRVRSHVPPERKRDRGHVHQNHPFAKPPFYLPMTGFITKDSVLQPRMRWKIIRRWGQGSTWDPEKPLAACGNFRSSHLCWGCRSAAVKSSPEAVRESCHGKCRGKILLLLVPQETKLESAQSFS